MQASGDVEITRRLVSNLDDYQALFEKGVDHRARGEASSAYFYYPAAARRLRELAPDTGAAVIHVDFARPISGVAAWNRARPFEAQGIPDLEPVPAFGEVVQGRDDLPQPGAVLGHAQNSAGVTIGTPYQRRFH